MIKIPLKLLKKLKSKLEEEKTLIEMELDRFAQKSKRTKGDWDARFPLFNGETGGSALEKAADETEEYGTLLEIERSLETKLQNINLALKKMISDLKVGNQRKERKYGICEKCGKSIEIRRLRACPEARTCLKCKTKQIKS